MMNTCGEHRNASSRAWLIPVTLLLAFMMVASCTRSGDKPNGTSSAPKVDRPAALASIAEVVIVPRLDAVVDATRKLSVDLDAFCSDPSQERLDAARQAWRSAADSWAATASFHFGPATKLRSAAGVRYPVNTDKIDRMFLPGGDFAVVEPTSQSVAQLGADKRGLGAIEYLLFGQTDQLGATPGDATKPSSPDGATPAGAAESGSPDSPTPADAAESGSPDGATPTDVAESGSPDSPTESGETNSATSGDRAGKQPPQQLLCTFVVAAADNVAIAANALRDAWTIGSPKLSHAEPFVEQFKNPGRESMYSNSQRVVDDLVNGMIGALSTVGDMVLGPATGRTASPADPTAADAGPAMNALAEARQALDSVQQVYGRAGERLSALVAAQTAKTGNDADASFRRELGSAIDSLERVHGPIGELSAEDAARGPLTQAFDHVDAARVTLRTEVASQLGVTISFSDSDGDG